MLTGCTGRPAAPVGAVAEVRVEAKDFTLTLSASTWPAGAVRIRFDNRGPDTHELLMFETGRPAATLPMRLDGSSVDEDSPRLIQVLDEQGTPPGESQTVTVNLAPGHYVVLCNMSGHYMAGMREEVTVG
jgi:uncharacterized cupredoxin-like copper-binding protein